MGEFKKGGLAWRVHSSEAAMETLNRELQESRERERQRLEKAAKERAETEKVYEGLEIDAKKREAESVEFRTRQDQAEADDAARERRRIAHVMSPEGKAEAEQARRRIEFFGNPPKPAKSRTQVAREKTVKDFFPRLSKILNPS